MPQRGASNGKYPRQLFGMPALWLQWIGHWHGTLLRQKSELPCNIKLLKVLPKACHKKPLLPFDFGFARQSLNNGALLHINTFHNSKYIGWPGRYVSFIETLFLIIPGHKSDSGCQKEILKMKHV